MAPGEVIGTVVADSIFGTVAILGADPEGIALTIRTESAGSADGRRYLMARDPLYLPNALRDALDDVSGFRQAQHWRWSARCLGHDGTVLASTSEDERSLDDLTAMVLNTFALYGDRVAAYEIVQSPPDQR